MKSGKSKLLRQKGIEICADLLYSGQSRKEIIIEITEKYKACDSTIDQWIKAARPILQARQQEAETIRAKVSQEEIEASAKRLNLSRERILEELAKVAFQDPRKMYTVDGGLKPIHEWDDETAGSIGSIESFDVKTDIKDDGKTVDSVTVGTNRKVKAWDKIRAIEAISKIMGYNAAEKKEIKATVNLNELPVIFE